MFVYRQTTGEFFQVIGFSEGDSVEPISETGMYGVLLGVGYAGRNAPEGRNNTTSESLSNVGPLPRGCYTIGPAEEIHPHLGSVALPLQPDPGNQMFNRGDFWIHSDNPRHDASHGSIVQAHLVREEIAKQVLLGNNHLLVLE